MNEIKESWAVAIKAKAGRWAAAVNKIKKGETMSNMSYCRFENTVSDLLDCRGHINDKLTGDYEPIARQRLVELCASVLEDLGLGVADEYGLPITPSAIEKALSQNEDDEGNEEG